MSSPDGDHDAVDETRLLLSFVRDRDVLCPLCGYNLRNLTRARCPECREELALAVSARNLRFGWFLATITPGLFSGIAAGFLLIPMIGTTIASGGSPPWFIVVLDAFGWLSGIFALLLIKYRFAFLAQRLTVQWTWAALAWAVHVAVFAVLVSLIFLL